MKNAKYMMKNIKYEKTGTVHRIRHSFGGVHGRKFYDIICGTFACGTGATPTVTLPSLNASASKTYLLNYKLTDERVTCKICLKILKSKADRAAHKNLKLKEVRMFQTSDGKTFNKKEMALEHEKDLKLKESKADFEKFVKIELFKNPTDEEEENIIADMYDKFDWLFSGGIDNLDDFSDVLWQLFINYEEIVDKALQEFKAIKG